MTTTTYNPRVYFFHSYHMYTYVCIYNNLPTYQFSVPRGSFLYFHGFSAATLSVDGVIWILFRYFPGGGKRHQIHFRCGLHSYTKQGFRNTYRLYIYIRPKCGVLSPYRPLIRFLPLLREESLEYLLFSICSLGCDDSPPSNLNRHCSISSLVL